MPAASPVNVPEACAVPPFKLKVRPELPDAEAIILPSVAVGVDVAVVVPVTVIVMPEQGFGAGPGVLPPLLQPTSINIKSKEATEIKLTSFFITDVLCINGG